MAETGGEPETRDQQPQIAKRKPDLECVEAGEEERNKKSKPDVSSDPSPPLGQVEAEAAADDDEEEDEEDYEESEEEEDEADLDGNVGLDNGKGVTKAVDKGKGKMVVVEDSDSDDSDDSSDGGGRGKEDDVDSDFSDDPLAEVDLDNILPSRTRRKAPPEPGAYLVTDQDGEDDDDSE